MAIPSSRAAILTPSPIKSPSALLDHVAQMDADAEFDAALGRNTGIALDEAVLHFDGAAHGVDDAAELDEASIASALNDTAMMSADCGVDQIAP